MSDQNIFNKFNDPTFGLWGKDKMVSKLRSSIGNNMSKSKIRRLLGDTYALQRHRVMNLAMKQKQFRRIVASEPFESVQIDLGFLPQLRSPLNNNVIGFIVFIDVFSRYLWIKPLTNRQQIHIKVKEMLDEMKRNFGKKPKNLTADNEFATLELQRLVAKELDGRLWLAEPHEKFRTGIVERVIRTLKNLIKRYLTQYNTTKYIDILPTLVNNYNSTVHGTINVTPESAIRTGKIHPKIPRKRIRKLKIGDRVRILDPRKRGWTKGDVPYYTKDVYTVTDTDMTRYRVRNENNPNDPRNRRPWGVHQLLKINRVITANNNNNNNEPIDDPYNVKVDIAQGYDEGIAQNVRRNRNEKALQRNDIDLNNMLDPRDRRQAEIDLGFRQPKPKPTRQEEIVLSDDEDDQKQEVLGEEPDYAQPIRRSRRKRDLRQEEIHPKPKPQAKKKKSQPETESDFEREESKIDKLIDKYEMQGKFHLAHNARERKKKLLNAKKKKLGRKNKSHLKLPKLRLNQSNFKLPKFNNNKPHFKLPKLKLNQSNFKPPSVSSSDHESDNDIKPRKHRYNLRKRKKVKYT